LAQLDGIVSSRAHIVHTLSDSYSIPEDFQVCNTFRLHSNLS